MSHFKVAHIRQQGVDLIIIPLDSSFDYKTSVEQNDIISSLQFHASGAGLRGTVVPVWRSGSGMKFIAPRNWHPFFQSLSWADIGANINRELSIPE